MKKLVSIVVPVYNSTQSLKDLSAQVARVFQDVEQKDYELIMINDCSPNMETWTIMEQLSKDNKKIKSVHLTKNSGNAAATLCGFNISSGDYIITMDDDLQHNPKDIPKLLEQENHDLVIASFKKKEHPTSKIFTSKLKSWFDYKLIGKPKHIYNSPFRLIKGHIVNSINELNISRPMIAAHLYRLTSDVVNVQVVHQPRKYSDSEFNLKKRMQLFSNLLINNSSFLLRISGIIGLLYAIFSFIYGSYLVFKQVFLNVAPAGWTSVMALTLFTSGLLFVFISVIGEYLNRIIENNERYPAYVISKRINC